MANLPGAKEGLLNQGLLYWQNHDVESSGTISSIFDLDYRLPIEICCPQLLHLTIGERLRSTILSLTLNASRRVYTMVQIRWYSLCYSQNYPYSDFATLQGMTKKSSIKDCETNHKQCARFSSRFHSCYQFPLLFSFIVSVPCLLCQALLHDGRLE